MCSLSRKDYGQMFKWTPLALILGFVIDLLLGDPRWLYHPVRVIGKEISFLEKKAPGNFSKKRPRGNDRQDLFMVILLCILGFVIPAGILFLAYKIHTLLGILLETFMCYQMLAARIFKRREYEGIPGVKKRRSGEFQTRSFHDRRPGYPESYI